MKTVAVDTGELKEVKQSVGNREIWRLLPRLFSGDLGYILDEDDIIPKPYARPGSPVEYEVGAFLAGFSSVDKLT